MGGRALACPRRRAEPKRRSSLEAEHDRTKSHTRRDFVIGAAATATGGVGATIAASSVDKKAKAIKAALPPATATQAQADVSLLNALLELERHGIAGYTVAARHLSGATLRVVLGVLLQERQHAAALERAVRDFGQLPRDPRAAAAYEALVPTLRGPEAALDYVLEVERQALDRYMSAIVRVSTEDVRVTIGAVLTAEAEHMAVILGRLGRPQLSGAFPLVRDPGARP